MRRSIHLSFRHSLLYKIFKARSLLPAPPAHSRHIHRNVTTVNSHLLSSCVAAEEPTSILQQRELCRLPFSKRATALSSFAGQNRQEQKGELFWILLERKRRHGYREK